MVVCICIVMRSIYSALFIHGILVLLAAVAKVMTM